MTPETTPGETLPKLTQDEITAEGAAFSAWAPAQHFVRDEGQAALDAWLERAAREKRRVEMLYATLHESVLALKEAVQTAVLLKQRLDDANNLIDQLKGEAGYAGHN